MHNVHDTCQRPGLRRGFTLVELLVSITVLLILAALTLSAMNTLDEDDVIEGARSTQSYFEGARDRAIFRKRPVGVRLQLDPNGTQNLASGGSVVASTLIYVGSPSETFKGTLVVGSWMGGPPSDTNRVLMNPAGPADFEADWNSLRTNRGLVDRDIQMPITIEIDTNTPPTTDEFMVGWDYTKSKWVLSREMPGTGLGSAVGYELELLPAILPNQQARELPQEAIVNLTDSKVPAFWYNSTTGQFISKPDIMFSPRGTGIGSASGSGMIHLHICGVEDRERVAVPPGSYFTGKVATHVIGNPRNKIPERLVSINPITGNITVADIPLFADADQNDIPDLNEDGNPTTNYDPYIYAEAGETAQ